MRESAEGPVLTITVADSGRRRPGPPERGRGNGLALIHTVVGSLDVEHDEDGTRVVMCCGPVAR